MAITNVLAPLIVAVCTLLHPLHVSVTEIEMDEKEKRLEIMMRVFMDDLETTLRQEQKLPDFDITAADAKTIDAMMTPYLQKDFKVYLDGKATTPKFLGHEQEGDALIFYIEVSPVKKWKAIKVQNSILHEAFSDQSNLVHVTVNGNVKSLRLTPESAVGTLGFE